MSILGRKFSTESDPIDTDKYFEKLFSAVTKLLFTVESRIFDHENTTKSSPAVSEKMLDYEGQPLQLYYSPSTTWRQFRADWNFVNRQIVLNHELSSVKARMKRRRSDVNIRNPKYEFYQFNPKPENYFFTEFPPDFSCLVYVIKIYVPFFKKCRQYQIKIMQEIHMHGKQTLKDLSNTIKCNIDYCGMEDVSDRVGKDPIGGISSARKDLFPSSFFYMDKFYRDGRFVDTTKEIRTWLNQRTLVEITTSDISLQELQLQIGRPYLYQHQGECEHIVMISDIRPRTNNDLPQKEMYPFVAAIAGGLPRPCMLCGHCSARWLVTNFLKLTIARAFLCHRCLLSYCYVDGRKAGDFQVYQYVDPIAIL